MDRTTLTGGKKTFEKKNKCLGCHLKLRLYHEVIGVYLGKKMSLAPSNQSPAAMVPSVKEKQFQKILDKG